VKHAGGDDEWSLVERLRAGDPAAYRALIEDHEAMVTRLAMLHVPDRAAAEEVAQEVWISVLEGIDRFEGRSSLRTWLFRVVANQAVTRARREGRTPPSAALSAGLEQEAPDGCPERRLRLKEARARLLEAIEHLPPAQRAVIVLRDVLGWSAEEVCAALEITDGNQRVLLHRARERAREALRDDRDL
jgi:RNA polymerase sigma-70 factor, ECF subfamily